MIPIRFKEVNVVFAENQKEYLPLPAYRSPEGEVISCWKISTWERLLLLLTGKLWLRQLTFNAPLQPQLPTSKNPWKEG